jgi:hypothetical protein
VHHAQPRHALASRHPRRREQLAPRRPRGFRTPDHKIHSRGDYKDPPPPGEHAGLHRYSKEISGDPVVIPQALRKTVGEAILKHLQKLELRVLAIAVAGMHAHILVELPDDKNPMKKILGRCKMKLPGRVWGGGGNLKRVDTREHQVRAYRYIFAAAWGLDLVVLI